jgi:DnaJ-class molecular chaperone
MNTDGNAYAIEQELYAQARHDAAQEAKDCNECGGSGEVEVDVPVPASNSNSSGYYAAEIEVCPECDGTGEESDD